MTYLVSGIVYEFSNLQSIVYCKLFISYILYCDVFGTVEYADYK